MTTQSRYIWTSGTQNLCLHAMDVDEARKSIQGEKQIHQRRDFPPTSQSRYIGWVDVVRSEPSRVEVKGETVSMEHGNE
jgi:hypothetical protein